MIKKISFIGISHLSLVYSSVYSEYVKKIVCYDDDKSIVSNLKKKFKNRIRGTWIRIFIKKKKNFYILIKFQK